jgi:hypothetical protein
MAEEFSTSRTDELKDYGFKPGIVLSYMHPAFGLDDMTASLCESTYSTPKTIPVKLGEPYTELVVLDTMKAVARENKETTDELSRVTIFYETPDWYAEGWVQNRSQRVRFYMITGDDRDIDGVYVQVIYDVPEADGLIYYTPIN